MIGGYCGLLGDACASVTSPPGGGSIGLRLPFGSLPALRLVLILVTAHLLAALGLGLACLVAEYGARRDALAACHAMPEPGDEHRDGDVLGGFALAEQRRLRFLAWRYRCGDLTEWPADLALRSKASRGDAAR